MVWYEQTTEKTGCYSSAKRKIWSFQTDFSNYPNEDSLQGYHLNKIHSEQLRIRWVHHGK